jgi:hypothetical protein
MVRELGYEKVGERQPFADSPVLAVMVKLLAWQHNSRGRTR